MQFLKSLSFPVDGLVDSYIQNLESFSASFLFHKC